MLTESEAENPPKSGDKTSPKVCAEAKAQCRHQTVPGGKDLKCWGYSASLEIRSAQLVPFPRTWKVDDGFPSAWMSRFIPSNHNSTLLVIYVHNMFCLIAVDK